MSGRALYVGRRTMHPSVTVKVAKHRLDPGVTVAKNPNPRPQQAAPRILAYNYPGDIHSTVEASTPMYSTLILAQPDRAGLRVEIGGSRPRMGN